MQDHKKWVSEVFDRAAPHYGEKSSSFFSYFGKRLVDHVHVEHHHHVLDIATGRGAILFPLAEKIDRRGKLIGIDISKQMLHETSQQLVTKGINFVDLIHMDAEKLDFAANAFDYVFCGFALFFFPQILHALEGIKRVLKTGGCLVVSIWGEDSMLDNCIQSEVQKVVQTKSLAATPVWDASTLQQLLEKANFREIRIFEEKKIFRHDTVEEWWESLWNHGTRAKLEALSSEQLKVVKKNTLKKASEYLTDDGLEEELQVFYGISIK